MECPACGHENRDAAKFCEECGRGIAAGGAPDGYAPREYTPRHLADLILQSRSALEGERKQVTVLFADVKGSMELAEGLDPEEWHAVLDRFFAILTDGVHRFEGTVNQYTGDGIMALFGAPIAHEDHAQRGCHAALHLRDELRRYADELRVARGLNFSVRTGLNSGEVVVGKIGDDLRMDYTARGHTVGLAHRMEQIAESGHVYLSEATAGLVEGFFELRDLGLAPVKGSRDPMRVYALEGPGALRTRLDVSRARGFSKFVGRAREVRALEAALDDAARGRGRVVGIAAEAGTGKSRLCYELAERSRERGIPVFAAHGLAHGRQMPMLPILELLRSFFGSDEADSDAAARDRIAGRLLRLGDELRAELPLVFDLMGVRDPSRPLESVDPEAHHQRLLQAIERVLFADPEPAVLLLEDLHWFDATSDGILARLVDAASRSARLVIVNFRPEYAAAWSDESHYEQVALRPLDSAAIGELLDDLLGEDASVAPLRELIEATTRGNPFFIEEVVQMLVDTGVVSGRRGARRLARRVDAIDMPESVRTVLAARIDRLDERDKSVLHTAAVIGKQVPLPLLARVAELPERELDAALARLRAAEFLYEAFLTPHVEYAFKHPLTEAVAYDTQLRHPRARVHQAVARAIEEFEADRLDEQAARLAYHWEAAGERIEAARWHSRAAEWIGLSEPSEALRHWRRVRHLAGRLDDAAGARLLALACYQTLNFGWRLGLSDEEMRSAVAQCRDHAARIADPALIVRVLCAYAVCLNFRGSFEENIAPLSQALQIAEAERSTDMEIDVLMTLQDSLWFLGRLEEAERLCTRVIELTWGEAAHVNFDGMNSHLESLAKRGGIRAERGLHRKASDDLERALSQSAADAPPENHVLALATALQAGALSGAVEDSLPQARRLSQLALKSGSPLWTLAASCRAGAAHVHNGRWSEAIGMLEHAVERVDQRGVARHELGRTLTALAEAYLGAERFDEAAAAAERAVRTCRAGGTRAWECMARIVLARVRLAAEGSPARRKVRDGLKRVEQLIDDTGARGYLPFVHEVRARLAALAGKPDDAERELGEAQRLFADTGATGHAQRLARELKSAPPAR